MTGHDRLTDVAIHEIIPSQPGVAIEVLSIEYSVLGKTYGAKYVKSDPLVLIKFEPYE